jgi:hypothetical protein
MRSPFRVNEDEDEVQMTECVVLASHHLESRASIDIFSKITLSILVFILGFGRNLNTAMQSFSLTVYSDKPQTQQEKERPSL